MSNLKSRFNKIKVGDKVEISNRAIDWYTEHLTWLYGRAVNGDKAYDSNDKEIASKDLSEVYAWVGARLSGKKPVGIVTHYGERDHDNKSGKSLKKKYVHVTLTFKTGAGIIKNSVYVSERDLKVLKKK